MEAGSSNPLPWQRDAVAETPEHIQAEAAAATAAETEAKSIRGYGLSAVRRSSLAT